MEALLITRADLVKYTAVNGNLDTDKMVQFIKIAQDIHLERYLGTDLLTKIKDEIIAETIENTVYAYLLDNYIKPMLIHWSMVELLPFVAYTIANKGVYKHSSENAVNVEKNEIDFLMEKERQLAQKYTQRFIDHMCEFENLYPEYRTNSGSDIHPDTDAFKTNWVL